jgi:hypothetical protein
MLDRPALISRQNVGNRNDYASGSGNRNDYASNLAPQHHKLPINSPQTHFTYPSSGRNRYPSGHTTTFHLSGSVPVHVYCFGVDSFCTQLTRFSSPLLSSDSVGISSSMMPGSMPSVAATSLGLSARMSSGVSWFSCALANHAAR